MKSNVYRLYSCVGTVCELEVLFISFAEEKNMLTVALAVRSDFNTLVTSGVILPRF
jgi:hypothetical protein